MNPIASLPVAVPLVAAAVLTGAAPLFRRRWADLFALLIAVADTVLCAVLLRQSSHGLVIHWFGGWHPIHGFPLGIAFVVEPLGAGLATLAALLVTCAFFYSWHYFDAVGTIYHALMLIFLAAMTGFCLTGDLFNLFVFFELMSVAAYALTSYKIEDKATLGGGINIAVTNSIGGFMILMGITLLYARTGALNLAQVGQALAGHHSDGLIVTSFGLICGGLLIKAAIAPFHFWLADAHAVAPTPVCVLFSGVMVTLGIYGAARVYWTIFVPVLGGHESALRWLLIGAGSLTTVLGATMCFLQRHIKRLLAFSTISHMGMIMAGAGLLSVRGLAGAAVYALGHGLDKAALFFCAGLLLARYGSVDEMSLRGRGRDMAWSGVMFFLGGLGLAGLPPFGTDTGKTVMEAAAKAAGLPWLSAIFIFGSALTGGAVLRVVGRVYFGWGPEPGEESSAVPGKESKETKDDQGHPPKPMLIPPALLLAASLGVGLWPGLPQAALRSAQGFEDWRANVLIVLHGQHPLPTTALTPPKPDAESLLSMVLSVALAFGLAGLTLKADSVPKTLNNVFYMVFGRIIKWLRALQSGDIRDYLAWLTAGMAASGGLLAALLR